MYSFFKYTKSYYNAYIFTSTVQLQYLWVISVDVFKPTKAEKSVTSIRIDKEMLDVIDNMAHETDISRNEVIVQCIDFALKNAISQKTGD